MVGVWMTEPSLIIWVFFSIWKINQSSETLKWQISSGINEQLQPVDIKKVNFLPLSLLLMRCLSSALLQIEVRKQCRQVCV